MSLKSSIMKVTAIFLFCVFAGSLGAQAVRDSSAPSGSIVQSTAQSVSLPLKRIVIFSSGLAYYEHSGTLNGPARLGLPFKTAAINDALKSLVLNDPASANPSVTYQSEQTLIQTLRSLKIDLSDEPDMARILARLRGAEVDIAAPGSVSGRIMGIEFRPVPGSIIMGGESSEPWLLLSTAQGLKLFNLKEISALSFKDPLINQDLNRALDLITASRNQSSRELLVNLPGNSVGGGSRQVSLSYVIPAPVWKVSYRLDLGAGGNAAANAPGSKPLFQGWAIVDNDGDTDWNNVELSLVAGRPASFIQNLYPPYYTSRPVLPLAIAGAAAAETHDSGWINLGLTGAVERDLRARDSMQYDEIAEERSNAKVASPAPMAPASPNVSGGAIQGAQGAVAGDQFEFTIKNPVSLDRRMSAMLPLVESTITARKVIIFSGAGAAGKSAHPRVGAEITNTSGMKLPAGPITVYDGGAYAGDALIEFWNEGEKRLISFGEDLSVTAAITETSTRAVSAVTVSGGVMTISRALTYFKTYAFKNAGVQSKQLVVEHPKTQGANLESPEADEETAGAYRFTMTLPASRELTVTVSEIRPLQEKITLLSLRPEAFASYVSNQEIPPQVRAALQRAADLRRAVTTAETAVADLEKRRISLVSDQERIRRNLEAAGSQTQQGQEYLKRLVSLDTEIDNLTPQLEKNRTDVKVAQKTYEDYLNALNL
ncbi:hypothetical protein AGMMS50293_16220 [Spirochaetia bacterium]|nr:hypothetical protein AGMMS50293_16220 [Spirochaetia bacterium]